MEAAFLAVAIPPLSRSALAKGGFAGVGTISTPLVALVMPPFEAAALLLPILIVQDVISLWVYRRDWSARNLQFLLAGARSASALPGSSPCRFRMPPCG